MPSERELLKQAQKGDADAAAMLVRRHFAPAWRAARAITRRPDLAEDAVQDAFERVFRHLDRFDLSKPFAPWLHRIVLNCSYSILREQRKTTALEAEPPSGRDEQANADDLRELVDAIAGLGEAQQRVVVLRLVLGYSPREVGAILDEREDTVSVRYSRALSALRAALRSRDDPQ